MAFFKASGVVLIFVNLPGDFSIVRMTASTCRCCSAAARMVAAWSMRACFNAASVVAAMTASRSAREVIRERSGAAARTAAGGARSAAARSMHERAGFIGAGFMRAARKKARPAARSGCTLRPRLRCITVRARISGRCLDSGSGLPGCRWHLRRRTPRAAARLWASPPEGCERPARRGGPR